jgi:hypothetical protein
MRALCFTFGTNTLKASVNATWQHIFYPKGIMTSANADCKAIIGNADKAANDRQVRYEARTHPDMLATLPYIMVPKKKLQAALIDAEEKAEAAERGRVQEKVDAWMKQVTYHKE